MPHRTTSQGASSGCSGGPWLVSLAMWSSCIRFVPAEGITVGELERLARTRTNVAGMLRWGYITSEPHPPGSHSKQLRPDAVIRLSAKGREAREVWQPLPGLVEERWLAR